MLFSLCAWLYLFLLHNPYINFLLDEWTPELVFGRFDLWKALFGFGYSSMWALMSVWWPFRRVDEILAFSKGMHVDWLLILDAACDLSIQEYGEAVHDALGCIDCFQQMVRAISTPGGAHTPPFVPLHTRTNTLQGWCDKINLTMTVLPRAARGPKFIGLN